MFKEIVWEKNPGDSKAEDDRKLKKFSEDLAKQGWIGSVGVQRRMTPEQKVVKNYRKKLRDYVSTSKKFEGIRFIKGTDTKYWYRQDQLALLLEMAVR